MRRMGWVESLGSGEYTTLDPLGWGGGLSSWAGVYAVNSCETIAIEDPHIAGRLARQC